MSSWRFGSRSRDSREREELDDQRRFYRTHVRSVYAYFAHSVSKEVAEDLTAGTFERALRAWAQYDSSRASERTWVLAIARNALTDHYRRESYRKTASLDAHPALAETLASSEDLLAREVSASGFVEILEMLQPREREVLALRFGADLSAKEVASLLGASEANVHQIASRALRRIRSQLEITDTRSTPDEV